MEERTLSEVRQFVGNGVKRLIELAVPESMERGKRNPDLFEKVFTDFKTYYVEHCQDNTGLYEGIAETLKVLKEKGVRMAVVSNKLQQGVTELVNSEVHTVGKNDALRLCDYMDVSIGERPEVARKPAPDMVIKALEELGVEKDEAVYIGDSEVDVLTARNSGLPCISVLWGFRNIDVLKEYGSDTFVKHPMDIISMFE
ncbi:MAG: HAD-IIIA family hydrolase, partial [Prevotella sp.]|nr:HAD-IIIA family hydrolase [Candidatus Prevotella equi]